jgi:hypothetical protein
LNRLISGKALLFMSLCMAHAMEPAVDSISMTTPDHTANPGWWPTKGDALRSQYVGTEICSGCHGSIALLQHTTPMFHASARATDAQILKEQPLLTFHESRFTYSLRWNAAGPTFAVTDGVQESTSPVVWAVGNGEYGQTYILEKNGTYIESRLSYFSGLKGLDITPGQASISPQEVDEALGRKLDTETTKACFQCHTSNAVITGTLDADKAIPGVTCESCHGPGAQHVAAMSTPAPGGKPTMILNPRSLSPSDSVDFCGACHSTWADVVMDRPSNMGAARMRFQPYRLGLSRCWGKGDDPRITCIACHNPHQPLVHDRDAYDTKCVACHSANARSTSHVAAKTCKVSATRCVSCHMPKIEVPEVHSALTDHNIRVVRANGQNQPQ